MSSQHSHINPLILGACATAGAVIGDSIGYAIGRKGGRPLLAWLGKKFPRHFGEAPMWPPPSAPSEVGHVGRLLRPLHRPAAHLRGPLAGVLHMPYWKFLIANILGGICWAGGTTAAVYYVGVVAEGWLKKFSYVGLGRRSSSVWRRC
ncbi:DedA family protein [Streptomyces murinus]|uniref:DedA family protein n=1 Tax=Streptomyces murinus TaxID=33900 RepID=UPI003D6974C1